MLQYNNTIRKFLKKNELDYTFVDNNKNAICYNKREINLIVSKYGMYKNKIVKKVCIDRIIGKDRGKSQNILNELNDLFDESGEGYKKRSVSMLDYDSDEIVTKLKNSFFTEMIELKEIGQEKYIIGNNGMHRVNLLRMHYFNELNKCSNDKEIDNLKKKYIIDVAVENLDIVKTYSRYLISLINSDMTIEDEIDESYLKTENIVLYDENNKYKKLDNNDLIKFIASNIDKILEKGFKEELIELYKSDEYFKEYVKLFPENFLD